jgi:hypothetical protein
MMSRRSVLVLIMPGAHFRMRENVMACMVRLPDSWVLISCILHGNSVCNLTVSTYSMGKRIVS